MLSLQPTLSIASVAELLGGAQHQGLERVPFPLLLLPQPHLQLILPLLAILRGHNRNRCGHLLLCTLNSLVSHAMTSLPLAPCISPSGIIAWPAVLRLLFSIESVKCVKGS